MVLESDGTSLSNAFDGSESSDTETAFTDGNLSREEMKIFLVTDESEIEAKQLIAFCVNSSHGMKN